MVSSPRNTRGILATLVDDVLQKAKSMSTNELALLLDKSPSYVTKLRAGYRPQRVGNELRQRLEHFARPEGAHAKAERPGDAPPQGASYRPGEDPLAFVAGVLWVIERDARHIASTASVTRARLGYAESGLPSAEAVQTAIDALATVAQQRGEAEGRSAANGE